MADDREGRVGPRPEEMRWRRWRRLIEVVGLIEKESLSTRIEKYDEMLILKLVDIEAPFAGLGGHIDGVVGVHMSVLDLICCEVVPYVVQVTPDIFSPTSFPSLSSDLLLRRT